MNNREPCPKCRANGGDSRGDNLIIFPMGRKKCFACGYTEGGKPWIPQEQEEKPNAKPEALPSDFTRQIPAAGWKWLLQYGMSYDYWKNHTGYSEKDNRLIFTVGSPVRFSQGRDLTGEGIKWKTYGRPHDVATVLGDSETSTSTVIVEDIISAHKVSQFTRCMPLFGTALMTPVINQLRKYPNSRIILWLDADQLPHMAKKVAKLSLFLPNLINVIHTEKDPKEYTLSEIEEILK